MANHRLFLDKPCDGVLGKSTKYKYKDEVLEIEWCGESSYHYFPEKSAAMVMCDGGMPNVVPLSWPRNFRWRVLWLCGIPKKMRFDKLEEFEEAAAAAGAAVASFGKGCKVAVVRGEDDLERYVAGWVDARVRDSEVRSMVRSCAGSVPAWFVKKVLGIAI